jgi:hypothetical protein
MPWLEEGKRRNGASRGAVSTLHDFVSSIFGYAARCVPPGFVIRGWTFLFFGEKRIDTLAVEKKIFMIFVGWLA